MLQKILDVFGIKGELSEHKSALSVVLNDKSKYTRWCSVLDRVHVPHGCSRSYIYKLCTQLINKGYIDIEEFRQLYEYFPCECISYDLEYKNDVANFMDHLLVKME